MDVFSNEIIAIIVMKLKQVGFQNEIYQESRHFQNPKYYS